MNCSFYVFSRCFERSAELKLSTRADVHQHNGRDRERERERRRTRRKQNEHFQDGSLNLLAGNYLALFFYFELGATSSARKIGADKFPLIDFPQ